jgi:PPP family 3-phenylpropionic acid transporter
MFPLSAFWFLYFCGLGVFFPYLTLYLRENAGLSGAQVGVILSILPLVGLLAQPFWGQVADRSGRRSSTLAFVTLCTAATSLALGGAHSFTQFIAGTAAMALCGTAVVPLAMSVSFAALRGRGPHAFGWMRMWGTVGYLAGVALYPIVLHRLAPARPDGFEPGLSSLFAVMAAGALAAACLWPWLPHGGSTALRAQRGEWRALLRSGPVVRLILYTFGGYLFLQGPTQLFPIFIRARGGDLGMVGRMWIVMLTLEIPLVALSGAGLRRFGARGLLGIGVLAGGVRWLGSGLTDNFTALYALQLLHGVTVAGLLLGGPLYLEQVVPESLRSTGQSLLSMLGVGIGGIASNTLSGWLIDAHGVNVPFIAGGLGGIALACAVPWVLPPVERR